MFGAVEAVALIAAVSNGWTLLLIAVLRTAGISVNSVSFGFGRPLYRRFGTRTYLDVRGVPFLGIRYSLVWPARFGHARRIRVWDLAQLVGLLVLTEAGITLLSGSAEILYLTLTAVGAAGSLFFLRPSGAGGRSLAYRLIRPLSAAEWDTDAAVLRLRVQGARLMLLRGDLEGAQKEGLAIRRHPGASGVDFYLGLEIRTFARGEYLEATSACEQVVAQTAQNDIRKSFVLAAADFALRAAEAGLLSAEDARARAKQALDLQGMPLNQDLQLRMDQVDAMRIALGPHPEKALRPARSLVKRSASVLSLADAYCTLALAQERSGFTEQATVIRARAGLLVPWLARAHHSASDPFDFPSS
ncbi:hypothetical protein [Streptomyces sp. NPDC014793]|uniref:hypothetical protein n=1 Tax=Streptomyces sp. NPDC014793 TaxID=3364914 RepID=UPI0036F7FD55